MEKNLPPIIINGLNKDDDNNKEKKDNKISLVRLESPSSDNELNSILFKYNQVQIESNKNNINEIKNKNIYSHDKEIMEDSIIYFSQKLKNCNIDYQRYLHFSIFLHVINLIVWYFDMSIFHTSFNIYSILMILIIVILQTFLFKHNFETISKSIYVLIQRMIYLYLFTLILFLMNMLYIIVLKILHNSDENNFYHKKMIKYVGFSLIIFLYSFLNVTIPIILFIKLVSVKRCIKNLSAAKGEVYDTISVKDVQIINSITN